MNSGVDPKLLEILVCPPLQGALVYRQGGARADLQAGPPRLSGEGRIPVMSTRSARNDDAELHVTSLLAGACAPLSSITGMPSFTG